MFLPLQDQGYIGISCSGLLQLPTRPDHSNVPESVLYPWPELKHVTKRSDGRVRIELQDSSGERSIVMHTSSPLSAKCIVHLIELHQKLRATEPWTNAKIAKDVKNLDDLVHEVDDTVLQTSVTSTKNSKGPKLPSPITSQNKSMDNLNSSPNGNRLPDLNFICDQESQTSKSKSLYDISGNLSCHGESKSRSMMTSSSNDIGCPSNVNRV